tara:strand:- start:220 stop:465 length:246 start_codon:yes stop_codon:yes gene_type:complete
MVVRQVTHQVMTDQVVVAVLAVLAVMVNHQLLEQVEQVVLELPIVLQVQRLVMLEVVVVELVVEIVILQDQLVHVEQERQE